MKVFCFLIFSFLWKTSLGALDEMMGVGPVDASSEETCPTNTFVCDLNDRYRTANGSCNNLQTPYLGMSFRPHARFLEPVYGDDNGSPREYAHLPSPRRISNALFDAKGQRKYSYRHTVELMAFGQFLAHDLAATPFTNATLKCCPNTELTPEGCYPIKIPDDDVYFNKTCMNFVRSVAANPECFPGRREQINEITSFIDGSMVYGSNDKQMEKLRWGKGGFLAMNTGRMLPVNPQGDCKKLHTGDYCQLAGDIRVDEIPHLSANHLLFVRVHNKIARKLQIINPHWDDDRLFQETRKIVIALIQHITYNEFLPNILGHNHVQNSGLSVYRGQYFPNRYNPDVDPRIRNAFATAVLRMGHTMIPPEQGLLLGDYTTQHSFVLSEQFFNTHIIFQNNGTRLPEFTRWLTYKGCMVTDRLFQQEIRNKLFDDGNGNSFDLPAFNIQRGRDHGIPPYNMWRQFCGLRPVNFEEDKIADHDKVSSDILKILYQSAADIDLYAGAITETPEGFSLLGPTFTCIFTRQFYSLKYGDRHFYEWNRGSAGFTKAQLKSIKEMKLSKLFCDMFDLRKIQPFVFRKQYQRWNRLTWCSKLQSLNLWLWKENVG